MNQQQFNQLFCKYSHVLQYQKVSYHGTVTNAFRQLQSYNPTFIVDRTPNYENIKILGICDYSEHHHIHQLDQDYNLYIGDLPEYFDCQLAALPFSDNDPIQVFTPKILIVIKEGTAFICHRSTKEEFMVGKELILKVAHTLMQNLHSKLPLIDESLKIQSNMTKSNYDKMFQQAKNHLNNGDIFQVVLSQKFIANSTIPGIDVFERACQVNPSPYQIYIEKGSCSIICTSPERLVKVENNKIEIVPIAGTRARKYDGKDALRANDLLNDPKELSEHLMLVDLGRNDVGKVSTPGSIVVDNYCQIKYYQQVMHLISNISGQLLSSKTKIDALESTFPAGTVSGAPKKMAKEIIRHLEPESRGLYGGAIAIFTKDKLDACIAIRTITKVGSKYTVQAGSGIVIEANSNNEYLETINKGRALIETLASFYSKGAIYDFDYR